jgi:membrane dipeptidase
VSHLSDESFADVAAIAASLPCPPPLLATHGGVRALHAHARNLTDAQLRAVAVSGGLVGITLHAPHLGVARWADHVVHAVEVMGARHVALGSDLDGNITPPADVPDSASLAILARALGDRGLGDRTIAALLGGNARRLLRRLPLGRCGGD